MSGSGVWQIDGSANVCCCCGQVFREGSVFFSALAESEDGFVRRDFCSECWREQDEADEATRSSGDCFCFWRTRRVIPESRATINTDLLWDFFQGLRDCDSHEKKVFRFVVALYLMRRRELKLIKVVRRQEGELLHCEKRSSDQQYEIEDPHLTEQQVQDAAERLSSLFGAELQPNGEG
ncbi:MAG: hypothetical protein J7M08_00290 [Planctomycetes bacterium]|nr:hypothetical protein [Planctomycetota bacterium]